MKRIYIVAAFICSFVFAASAQAAIQFNLGTPANNANVIGKILISGFAYAENGSDVTIYFRVDGTTRMDLPMPCCSRRLDVKGTDENVPENTGFGFTLNLGVFNEGANSIGIEIQADGEDTVTEDHNISVGKIGGTEVPGSFSFMEGRSAVDKSNPDNAAVVLVNALSGESSNEFANLRMEYDDTNFNVAGVQVWNETDETTARYTAMESLIASRCGAAG